MHIYLTDYIYFFKLISIQITQSKLAVFCFFNSVKSFEKKKLILRGFFEEDFKRIFLRGFFEMNFDNIKKNRFLNVFFK